MNLFEDPDVFIAGATLASSIILSYSSVPIYPSLYVCPQDLLVGLTASRSRLEVAYTYHLPVTLCLAG